MSISNILRTTNSYPNTSAIKLDEHPHRLLSVNYSGFCNPSIHPILKKELEEEISQILEKYGFTRFIVRF